MQLKIQFATILRVLLLSSIFISILLAASIASASSTQHMGLSKKEKYESPSVMKPVDNCPGELTAPERSLRHATPHAQSSSVPSSSPMIYQTQRYRSGGGAGSRSTRAPSSNSSRGGGCFAGSETVRLESGEDRQISLIMPGDRILAADALGRTSFSEVVFMPHEANSDTAMFVHIITSSGRDIKMTKCHVLPAGACGSSSPLALNHASLVVVDNCVMTVAGKERVSSVETILAEGLYTIVTKEEFVVVNGIIASPFAYNHLAGNLFYNIHRFLYDAIPCLLLSPSLRTFNEVRIRNSQHYTTPHQVHYFVDHTTPQHIRYLRLNHAFICLQALGILPILMGYSST